MVNLKGRKSTLSGLHIPVPTFPLNTPRERLLSVTTRLHIKAVRLLCILGIVKIETINATFPSTPTVETSGTINAYNKPFTSLKTHPSARAPVKLMMVSASMQKLSYLKNFHQEHIWSNKICVLVLVPQVKKLSLEQICIAFFQIKVFSRFHYVLLCNLWLVYGSGNGYIYDYITRRDKTERKL